MPKPHNAKPAKPAPSVSTMSRCSTGTAFAFATPWMSTNCASTKRISCLRRNSFASVAFMSASPLCFYSSEHGGQRGFEIVTEGRIAPDPIAAVGGSALRYDCDRDANHHRHHDLPLHGRQDCEVHVARFREHGVPVGTGKLERAILA